MLELICIGCNHHDYANYYIVRLKDSDGKLYELNLFFQVCIFEIFQIDSTMHKFTSRIDGVIQVTIIQKYNFANMPELIEVKGLKLENAVLTLSDTKTHEIFKVKVNIIDIKVGQIFTINLKELGLLVKSMANYYNGDYTIEHWIYKNNIIATL
jgi:hypothetical protein